MRLQLTFAIVLAASTAHADGTLAMRGVYYKERSTRVMQPMLDAMFDAGTHGIVIGHFLVDAITSASASSGAVAAEPFTERRYEGGLGYVHELKGPEDTILDTIRLGGDAKYSRESDYFSYYAGVRGEAELADKNATLGVGGGISKDKITNAGAQGPMGGPDLLCRNDDPTSTAKECPLTTISVFSSASHLLSPNALVGASYDLAKLNGYTSNPYRTVFTGTGTWAEKHPNERLRQAVAISGRYYLVDTRTALIGSYRYYWDDWQIHAHTPELRVVQEVGDTIDASVRYRYYTQDAAFFWAKRYADADAMTYVTYDPKMEPFDGHLMEAKLGMLGSTFDFDGRWGDMRLEAVLQYLIQHNRFGNAVEAHVAVTVPFEY